MRACIVLILRIFVCCYVSGTTIWTIADIEADHSRNFLYPNAEAKKISFPLAGMRLKRQDLWVRVVASSLAFLIGLFKTLVTSAV